MLKEHGIDLIILDVMLPGVSGFELCRRVRASGDFFTIPIILVSAMASNEEVMHGLAQGADDFLAKPVRITELINRVNNLIVAGTTENTRDTLTELAGSKIIKLEMQRAITRQQRFAAIYAELLNMPAFARAAGGEARAKTIRHFGRRLHRVGEDMSSSCFRVGHLGGGHFLSIIEPEQARTYCEKVKSLWDDHLPELYEAVGCKQLFQNSTAKQTNHPHEAPPLLAVLMCITVHNHTHHESVQQLFETISHLRQGALANGAQGIYVDRRQGRM